jgi:GPH family glycoside/pentoside/hexuronide:cation symporter
MAMNELEGTSPPLARALTGAATNPAAKSGRLGWRTLGFYGVGGLAEQLPSFAESELLLFYLTIVCGMSGSEAGVILGLTLLIDGIAAPLVGSLTDNSRSRHGRRHPFMLAGAVPLAIAFGLLFSIPSGLTGVPLFAYALIMLIIARSSEAVYNVPYVALGAELTTDYHERSLVVSSRYLFSKGATLLGTFLAYGVFLKGAEGLNDRGAYSEFAWVSGALILVAAGCSILGTLNVRNRLYRPAAKQSFALRHFASEIGELFRNPSFRVLFAMAVAFMMSWGVGAALSLHANKYFWHLTTAQILTVQTIGIAGGFFGVFLVATLRRFMEKRTIVMSGMGMIAASKLTLVPLSLAGLLPASVVVVAVTLATMLSYAGLSITLIGYQSMMADTADQHEQMFGSRREGLCYAGTTLAAKMASGLGVMVAGVALDLIGFPHGVSRATTLVIPEETLRNLGLTYGPAAGLLTLVAMIILLKYRLSKDAHAAVQEEILRRRVEEEDGA